MNVRVGDKVMIRGDLRKNLNGECAYLPGQLIVGKYVRHAYKDRAWTGTVERISGDMVRVSGTWMGLERVEKE